MQDILGSSVPVFIGITLVIMGFATYMAGQALAAMWRPAWQIVPYVILLGMADRFLAWALFQAPLFAFVPYLFDTLVLAIICLTAYRLTRVRRMVSQYPWVYERAGLFGWRERAG